MTCTRNVPIMGLLKDISEHVMDEPFVCPELSNSIGSVVAVIRISSDLFERPIPSDRDACPRSKLPLGLRRQPAVFASVERWARKHPPNVGATNSPTGLTRNGVAVRDYIQPIDHLDRHRRRRSAARLRGPTRGVVAAVGAPQLWCHGAACCAGRRHGHRDRHRPRF